MGEFDDKSEMLTEVDDISTGDLIGNLDAIEPPPGTVPYESDNPKGRPRDGQGRFSSESAVAEPAIEITGDFVGSADEFANQFAPKKDVKEPVKTTVTAPVGDKPSSTPASLTVPADLLQQASEYGIPAHEAARYPSIRALRAELVTRHVERNPQILKPSEPVTAKAVESVIPDVPFDEKALSDMLDEKAVGVLKGLHQQNLALKQALEKRSNETSELRKLTDSIVQRQKQMDEANAQYEAQATFKSFDDLIDEQGDEFASFLGKPSVVHGQPDSEQYGRWVTLSDRYAMELEWSNRTGERVDQKTLQMRAIGALYPDLIQKQTRTGIAKAADKQKGSAALRGSTRRAATTKEPAPESIYDRAKQFRDSLMGAGLR